MIAAVDAGDSRDDVKNYEARRTIKLLHLRSHNPKRIGVEEEVEHPDMDEESGIPHRDQVVTKLMIIVSDNGPGFPEKEINKVFDKFYRLDHARSGGTGLGLSIVKGFIEAHEGTIELSNLISGGAKFKIEIPSEASYVNSLKNE